MKKYKNLSLTVSWYIRAIKARSDFLSYWTWDFSASDLYEYDNDIKEFWDRVFQYIWVVVDDFQGTLWLTLDSLEDYSLDVWELEDGWFIVQFSCQEWNDCWDINKLVFIFDSEWILISIDKTWNDCSWLTISYNPYLQDYMMSWLKSDVHNDCILPKIWGKTDELFYYIVSENPYLFWYIWEDEELYVWENAIMITFNQLEENWNMLIYLTNNTTGEIIELWKDIDFLSMDISQIVSIIATNLANAWWYK